MGFRRTCIINAINKSHAAESWIKDRTEWRALQRPMTWMAPIDRCQVPRKNSEPIKAGN